MSDGHGGSRPGAGRPRGSRNRRTMDEIDRVYEMFPDWSPLMHFARVANDPNITEEMRLDAAKAAAPYMHAKAKPMEMFPDELVVLTKKLVELRENQDGWFCTTRYDNGRLESMERVPLAVKFAECEKDGDADAE